MSILPTKKLDLNDNQISIISENFEIEGTIKAKSFVRIDGIVHGDVFVEEGLIMGEKGVINGDISTKEAIIFGTLNGNLKVESLEIKSTGKITGEIATQLLQMDPGSKYNGKITMIEEKDKGKAQFAANDASKDADKEENSKNSAK